MKILYRLFKFLATHLKVFATESMWNRVTKTSEARAAVAGQTARRQFPRHILQMAINHCDR